MVRGIFLIGWRVGIESGFEDFHAKGVLVGCDVTGHTFRAPPAVSCPCYFLCFGRVDFDRANAPPPTSAFRFRLARRPPQKYGISSNVARTETQILLFLPGTP